MISKRILTFVALAAGIVALTGCSDRADSTSTQDRPEARPCRIGIMTGTVAQNHGDFRAGEQVERNFAGRVLHVTYPDNYTIERETVVAQLAGLAADPEVRVILVGQAVPGSSTAARRIRDARPDVLIGFVGPHEDPDVVSRACDIAIRSDPDAAGADGEFGWPPVDSVAILAISRLLVDSVEDKADFRDSTTVQKYLEAEAGGPVRLRRHDPGGNQWLVTLDSPRPIP